MMRYLFLLLIFSSGILFGQPGKTKLMVGIVVDQMRPDYLSRFYDRLSENGFKRLLKNGFVCYNTHINYTPTVTGPGHASIYSGTTPKYHGIIENDWYDRKLGKNVYCAIDTLVQNVGNESAGTKSYSARNLLVSNLSDELKISTNRYGKVIAMSLKDRGATMPAGHLADGAFWFDQVTGNFISSTYYVKQLPQWVSEFNGRKQAQKYLDTTWDLLLPNDAYAMSMPDDNTFETLLPGKNKPVFPYKLNDLAKTRSPKYTAVYSSPFGNALLCDLAMEAIKNAGLGKDQYPDLLAISFSSTDVVGHLFGPQSVELNDTYLRLDLDIARLIDALDKYIGKDNYTLFLTADHGAGEVPDYLSALNIPSGYIDNEVLLKGAAAYLESKFGTGRWIQSYISNQFYLNYELINKNNIDIQKISESLADYLRKTDGIAYAFTASQLIQDKYTSGLEDRVQMGFFPARCGDVIIVSMPGWNEKSEYAATHGSPYEYDTHIPLIWYGSDIKPGSSYKPYNVTDIAPTVSEILHIKYPGSCIGNPIEEILKK